MPKFVRFIRNFHPMRSIKEKYRTYKLPAEVVRYKGGFRLTEESLLRNAKFAYSMIHEGGHRCNRSGGSLQRDRKEIFENVMTGKIAETAVHDVLTGYGYDVSDPDYSVETLGKWDSGDLDVFYPSGKVCRLSVKATKSIGQFMWLETKDWGRAAEYLPACRDDRLKQELFAKALGDDDVFRTERLTPDERRKIGLYDKHVLVRISNDFYQGVHEIMRKYGPDADFEVLWQEIRKLDCEFEISGFIYQPELMTVIKAGMIIRKDELYGRKGVPMDAENYYIHICDMHRIEELNPIAAENAPAA